jgi:hypothetical protein
MVSGVPDTKVQSLESPAATKMEVPQPPSGVQDERFRDARTSPPEMKIEVIVIPVSELDRAKRFYGELGWRLDMDVATSDEYRAIQLTPPGSACSIMIGRGITTAAPGIGTGTTPHLVRYRGHARLSS